jgi:hypothetical protein
VIIILEIERKFAELCVFRRGRQTADLILGIRWLIEKTWKHKKRVNGYILRF